MTIKSSRWTRELKGTTCFNFIFKFSLRGKCGLKSVQINNFIAVYGAALEDVSVAVPQVATVKKWVWTIYLHIAFFFVILI